MVPPGPAQGSGGRAVKSDAVAGGTEQISNQDGGGLGSRSKGFPSGNDEAGARGRGGARSGSCGAKVRGEPLLKPTQRPNDAEGSGAPWLRTRHDERQAGVQSTNFVNKIPEIPPGARQLHI